MLSLRICKKNKGVDDIFPLKMDLGFLLRNLFKLKMNIHSDFIDKRISQLKGKNKWNTKIINTSHDDFINDFSSNVFTNLIQSTFTKTYMKQHNCSDCGNKSEERCHGIGEERPLLIKRALKRVYPDISKEVILKEIIIAFLEEHKHTKFTFKCRSCHKKESIKN